MASPLSAPRTSVKNLNRVFALRPFRNLELAGSLLVALLSAGVSGCVGNPSSQPPLKLTSVPHVDFSMSAHEALESPTRLGGESRECLTAPTPADVRYRVVVPPRAFLTFAVGIKSAVQKENVLDEEPRAARKVLFRIWAGEEEPSEEIFRKEIHVSRADQWLDQVVDMSRFSQKETWLSFQSEYVDGSGDKIDETSPSFLGTFAEPALHDRARYGEGRAVILVSIDTLRRDHVSLYGYPRLTTPGLSNFADDGVVFDDAVSTSSWTLPAHASLLTSLNPSFHGAVDLHQGLSSSLMGLPKLLQERGFFTQAIVTHLYLSEQYGFGAGFDRHTFLPETRAQQVTDRALAFLTSKGDEDFFLFLHYYDPHWHYDPPSPYDRSFDPTYEGTTTGVWWDFKEETAESIDPRDLHHIVALYDGEILYTDRHLARLFREMKRLRIYDKAMIIVTSDHGEEFLEHGGWEHQKTLYEEQIRVPLVVKLSQSRHRRQQVREQVSLIDIAPTVLADLGLPSPSTFQGRNLLPLLEGGESASGTVWSETEHTLDGSHKIAARRGANADKAIFSLFGEDRSQDLLALYDLSRDPGESIDLAGESPASMERERLELERYLGLLAEWRLHPTRSVPVELTPEQLDKLRALGYAR